MDENIIEFNLSGCIFTGENKIDLDELNDAFIDMCVDRGWKFLGIISPLEDEEE